jgi:hypothetical protein
MRGKNIDVVLADQTRQLQTGCDIERISHRQFRYVLCRNRREFSQKRRGRNHGSIDLMATTGESVGQIGKMSLAAAKLAG